MAGSPKKRAKNATKTDDPKTFAELTDALDAALAELNRLRPIVADLDSSTLSSTLPTLEIGPNFPPPILTSKILAYGVAGLTPTEIRSKIGISLEKHSEVMKRFPRYQEAFQRAGAIAHADLMRRIRLAVTSKDWRFPYQNAVKMASIMFEDNDGGANLGDASALIVLDLSA